MTDDSKEQMYEAFRDQEPEINELEKLADLALYVCDLEYYPRLHQYLAQFDIAGCCQRHLS